MIREDADNLDGVHSSRSKKKKKRHVRKKIRNEKGGDSQMYIHVALHRHGSLFLICK